MARTYGQLCPLARALDRIGDRWTPLVIRDLSRGPQRYSDLLNGLPGIGTTLLADRLRRLQEEGLVARSELPPPAASAVYELTDAGRELVAALLPLASWGLRFLEAPSDEEIRPEWVAMFIQGNFDPVAARGVQEVYEFRMGTNTFHVAVSDGAFRVNSGSASEPDAVIDTDWANLIRLARGEVGPSELAASGAARFTGDPEALRRSYEILVGSRLGALTA